MTRGNAALVVGLGALALGTSCSKPGDGLILVELTSSTTPNQARVIVTTPGGQTVLGMATAAWPVTHLLKLGVYVPKDTSGSVDVIACGFDDTGNLVASTPNDPASFTVTAVPSAASAIVSIALTTGSSPALCGAIGAGGHGGGGSAGTSGNGGTGGVAGSATAGVSGGGTGGSIGGTGGSTGGTSGTGGVAGTGGTVGTGGGGAVGTAGRGGSGGTGGVAGTGGRGGTGGTAGTGTGGSAGTGTGGTGGSAAPMWGTAVGVSTVVGSTQTYPSVAVDPAGNAVVIYEQGTQIWANKYTAQTGTWGTPGAVDSRGSVQSKPSIAVDKNGNYLAVWGLQTGSALQGIWQSTSSNGTTWSTPTSITATIAYGPVLAMNANGAAIVSWEEQINGSMIQAAASVRTAPGAAWSTPTVMRAGDDNGDRYQAVAMAGNGNAFVGWVQGDGSGNASDGYDSVWIRQWTAGAGAGWNAAALFEGYNDHNVYGIQLAANTAGDAIGTYIQVSNTNPATIQLWSRRYSVTTSSFATNPLRVFEADSIDGVIVPPSVALDDNGNATVAFPVQTSTGFQVQVSRTSPTDSAWPTVPTALETDDIAKSDPSSSLAYVTQPSVKVDAAGNVTCVWRKRTTASALRFDLVSRRYSAGTWGPQVSLESNTTNSVFWPVLAVGPNGTAVATWYFANTLDVWANVFK